MNATKAAQHKHHADIHARLMTPKRKQALNHDEIVPVATRDEQTETGPLTVKMIQRVVAEHFGLSVGDLLSRDSVVVITPRQIAMRMAYRYTRKSTSKLSILFGMGRSAIRKSTNRIEAMRHDDPQLASDLAAIEARLNALT